jgi:hypothetical protein
MKCLKKAELKKAEKVCFNAAILRAFRSVTIFGPQSDQFVFTHSAPGNG